MTTTTSGSVLKDVVAYVDVWSSDKTANYSKPFVQQLQEMGAQVSKTFNKQVTHVVFNNGHPATWRKAKKSGDVRLVSVLWVGRCYDDGVRVDEELYPAIDETNPVLKNKKHRCMQPKDSPERTPENDRRMRKKLDKMMKDLVPKQPLVTDVSPIIIDEENGIVYSPALKRSDYMAQRLKDMKEKRENLSPTASQMVESCSPTRRKPSLGSTPTVLKLMCRGNECTVAAGLTEIPSEDEDHNKQVSLSLQNMVNETKAMRTLVMTSMPSEKQQTVGQVVKALGGFAIVDRVCESTTHVVSGGHRRTLNILLGIARGCWILSFEWILWCLEQRQWIPEEPYELSDQFPAAQICRLQRHLSAGEHQQDLFQSQPAMFVSQHSQPPTQSLVELIQLCGGTVCKTVRQAGICIGKYSGRRPEGSRILSEQWVLDSITHLKQLSYDNYDLE
uniref:BRCT domain-containing protein n=1 Tax=Dicentrarchus labrax TaxID=13489 RepID=A0A8C4DC84_DICLA